MLRFGVFAGDKVFPLLIGRKIDKVLELDEMSGVVRDVATYPGGEAIKIGRRPSLRVLPWGRRAIEFSRISTDATEYSPPSLTLDIRIRTGLEGNLGHF